MSRDLIDIGDDLLHARDLVECACMATDSISSDQGDALGALLRDISNHLSRLKNEIYSRGKVEDDADRSST